MGGKLTEVPPGWFVVVGLMERILFMLLGFISIKPGSHLESLAGIGCFLELEMGCLFVDE